MSAGIRVVYTRVPGWVVVTLNRIAKDRKVSMAMVARQVLVEAVTRLEAERESEDKA